MNNRNTLICTVGTSLFGNLDRLAGEKDRSPLSDYYAAGQWNKLADELLKINPADRVCGAEINAIEEGRKKRWLNIENLFFLVSDTDKGRKTGRLLTEYFCGRQDMALRNLEFEVVEGLVDDNPWRFKAEGLRNLVRCIGGYIQRIGGSRHVVLDATGGYKAQISIAVIMGQAMNIPVLYKHESFSEIIDFPPLPVSFDYSILGENADLLALFEKGEVLTVDEVGTLGDKMRVLLTEVTVDGKQMYEMNPIGQVYLTSFRMRNPRPAQLVDAIDRSEPSFGNDHHYPKGFKEFALKIWNHVPWIRTIHSESYDGQKGIKGNGFAVRNDGKKSTLQGAYRDKGFGARFNILVTDDSQTALAWAADYLNREYGG